MRHGLSDRASLPRLIGMVHLRPLPGAPRYGGDLSDVIKAAVGDARNLAQAGFDGLMVENYGDLPFYRERVPPETVAAMAVAIGEVGSSVEIPFGVNVLRNDGESALAIAAATGASYIRINVLAGTMMTDQGPITGDAATLLRIRSRIAPGVSILADVFVKHAAPPPDWTIEEAAVSTYGRAGAEALIVSGSGTGQPTDVGDLDRVAKAVPEAPIYVGSGATAGSASTLLERAYGLIVGTAVKVNGMSDAPVDSVRAGDFVKRARG